MAEGEEQKIEGEEINQKPEDSEKVTLLERAQKKLLNQQRLLERKKLKKERKRLELEEKLSLLSEEEKLEFLESRKRDQKESLDKAISEKEKTYERLNHAKLYGQNFVIDFQFADLMTPDLITSLSRQIIHSYAVNSRCASPAHLWMTGCTGVVEDKLSKISGIQKWIISTEKTSYIETFKDYKDKLVYLTADAETVLDDLDLNDYYIIGALVYCKRWKGITLKKAREQGIRTAKLPIEAYLKELELTSPQVLTVSQVVEILLKYMETKDWKASFFQVIPQRKRFASEDKTDENKKDGEDGSEGKDQSCEGQKKIKISSVEDKAVANDNKL